MSAFKPYYSSIRTSNDAHASYLARAYGAKAKEIFLSELEERRKSASLHDYLEGWKKRVPNSGVFNLINFGNEQWMD